MGGGGHGLEVGPRRLLDEPVADGDLAAALVSGSGAGGGCRRLDPGWRAGEEVLEADVGVRRLAEGGELEIDGRDRFI